MQTTQHDPKRRLALCAVAAILAGTLAACGGARTGRPAREAHELARLGRERQEVMLFSLSLIDTDYRFGGKNPEAGVDCSGMVSYVYRMALGRDVTGSAADIARRGRRISKSHLEPGDLVFFDTRGGPYTHVGIYLGDDRFIHAPSSAGKVRIEPMSNRYFSQRFTEARTYLD